MDGSCIFGRPTCIFGKPTCIFVEFSCILPNTFWLQWLRLSLLSVPMMYLQFLESLLLHFCNVHKPIPSFIVFCFRFNQRVDSVPPDNRRIKFVNRGGDECICSQPLGCSVSAVFWNVVCKAPGFDNMKKSQHIEVLRLSFPRSSETEFENVMKTKSREVQWFKDLSSKSPLRPRLVSSRRALEPKPPVSDAMYYTEKEVQARVHTALTSYKSVIAVKELMEDSIQ